ncbi:MAG: PilZ domain-containing protein [Phycisphaerae bacterium]|nr:PilZ domain-containing protein [Phycisphaerae bacterium]
MAGFWTVILDRRPDGKIKPSPIEERAQKSNNGDIMQDLNIRQIGESLHDAVERHIPLSLSVQTDGWVNLHSRFLAVRDDKLLVELPILDDGVPHEFVPAEKVALSFKLKHHKYLSSARVAGLDKWRLEDGTDISVLSLCYPMQMQRLQRRSFTRVEVPAGRIVRVSFWSGDKNSEPARPSGAGGVWAGKVVDLSAGGFQAVLSDEAELEEGQTVGVRLAFGPGETSVYCDAQFRHGIKQADGSWSLGFQFIGLAQTDAGRDVLRTLGRKMNEFIKFAARTKKFSAPRTA